MADGEEPQHLGERKAVVLFKQKSKPEGGIERTHPSIGQFHRGWLVAKPDRQKN